MTYQTRARSRKRIVLCAFLLTFFSASLGMVFSVLKSPQARGESYLAAAMDELAAGRDDAAADMVIAALRLDPSAPQSWAVYAVLMDGKGRSHAAQKARHVASLLQQNPDAALPAYAMPAEFRLSFLADDTLVP